MQVVVILTVVVILIVIIANKQSYGTSNKKQVVQSLQSASENKNDNISYFLNNKIGYFTQAKTKENAIFISEMVAKVYYKSLNQKEFNKIVLERIPEYDIDTLRIERENFILMAENYDTWKYIQKNKDILPLLKYGAIGDETTCKTCKKLNNIVRPVDDEFWDIYFPPNCPECRCIVQQYEKCDVKTPTDLSKKKIIQPINYFAINVGKHDLKQLY